MSFVKAQDGTNIFYKDWGTGQPVMFSHGWPLSADAWDAQMLFLGQQGYRVIGVNRLNDDITEIANHVRRMHTDEPFVLHNQHDGLWAGALGHCFSGLTRHKLLRTIPFPANIGELHALLGE